MLTYNLVFRAFRNHGKNVPGSIVLCVENQKTNTLLVSDTTKLLNFTPYMKNIHCLFSSHGGKNTKI